MAQQLWAAGNASAKAARLTSTEHPKDACEIPEKSIQHTGGSDDDFILIPDCSGSQYYDDHHILIRAGDGSWTVSIWNNDDEDHLLYWNTTNAYSENHPVNGSNEWPAVTILIEVNGNVPVVHCSPWT